MLPKDFWTAVITGSVIVVLVAAVAFVSCLNAKEAIGQTTLEKIRQCESDDNYEAANWDDWHVWWPYYGSHWRVGSYGAYQFGWARWHHAAHQAGEHEHAHTRPDRVPQLIQDKVAEWQYDNDPTVWSCYNR